MICKELCHLFQNLLDTTLLLLVGVQDFQKLMVRTRVVCESFLNIRHVRNSMIKFDCLMLGSCWLGWWWWCRMRWQWPGRMLLLLLLLCSRCWSWLSSSCTTLHAHRTWRTCLVVHWRWCMGTTWRKWLRWWLLCSGTCRWSAHGGGCIICHTCCCRRRGSCSSIRHGCRSRRLFRRLSWTSRKVSRRTTTHSTLLLRFGFSCCSSGCCCFLSSMCFLCLVDIL
mmetsp:Transcript_735/g.971  ORF Transcript_735/g.971 Transcript_735/m.971 type:complete len:224 (-) Transcript_735:328-999(-)